MPSAGADDGGGPLLCGLGRVHGGPEGDLGGVDHDVLPVSEGSTAVSVPPVVRARSV